MVIPALGDERILVKARLGLALLVSFFAVPIVKEFLPQYTESNSTLTYLILSESLIGIMLGLYTKIYYGSIQILGNLISLASGLSAATIFDPSQKEQITIFSSFISVLTLVTIFATDTHHIFLIGFFESYEKLKPGLTLLTGDIADTVAIVVNNSFILAFKISAPFLIIGVAILTASGLLARLMPTLQVLFVITPAQILVMFCVLYIVINKIISLVIESMVGVF